ALIIVAREWFFRRAIASGRMEEAAQQLDALLTLDEAGAPGRLKESVRHLGDPVFRATLARALRDGRPWRALLPAVLADTSGPSEVESLLASIANRGGSSSESALRARLLERLGRARQARAQWHASLTAPMKRFDDLVFDGGFEAPSGPPPYAWQFESQKGTAVGVDAARAFEGGRSLAVQFDGRTADFTGVWQDLALAPGVYRLTLASSATLSGARPIAWTVSCRPSERPLARLDVAAYGAGWKAFSVTFQVPGDCPAQQLRLTSIGPSQADRSVDGEIRFDAMRITPAGAVPATPP
ncbi:hypothetical protein, partial [Cognatilysobacter lacus]|uniref:hypothetical protein n=1 Tax=Cognatilysobacter lacus TaxID=1643323 RepID=UPI001659D637